MPRSQMKGPRRVGRYHGQSRFTLGAALLLLLAPCARASSTGEWVVREELMKILVADPPYDEPPGPPATAYCGGRDSGSSCCAGTIDFISSVAVWSR